MKPELITGRASRLDGRRHSQDNHLWRAVSAQVRAFVNGVPVGPMVKAMYPEDPVTPLILRAATTQATTTDPAWAGPVAHLSISEAIEDIVSMSVSGRLEAAGALRIDLGRNATVRVPGRATSAAEAGQFVVEGAPGPVRQLNILAGPVLSPTKLEVIIPMTQELVEASNIEDVVRVLVTEASGIAIDAAMFSSNAATPAAPAGLLNGLVALAPSTATLGFDACAEDLGELVRDIATRGGGRRAFFVGSPAQITAIRFWAGGQFGVTPQSDVLPIAAAASLSDGTVVCVEPESLVFAIGEPQFTVSSVASLHMEDTTPKDIVSGGAPSTPVKSMFQIFSVALKMTCRASWGVRAPHVSFMDAVTW